MPDNIFTGGWIVDVRHVGKAIRFYMTRKVGEGEEK